MDMPNFLDCLVCDCGGRSMEKNITRKLGTTMLSVQTRIVVRKL
jgi:hypothetical protein